MKNRIETADQLSPLQFDALQRRSTPDDQRGSCIKFAAAVMERGRDG